MAAADPIRAERITHRLFVSLEAVATPGAGQVPPESGTSGIEARDLISDVEVQLLKSVTLARMAERAVATDRYRARRWLEEAIDGLVTLRGSTYREGWFHAPSAAMATLVPLAERIDPALAHELFLRSLASARSPIARRWPGAESPGEQPGDAGPNAGTLRPRHSATIAVPPGGEQSRRVSCVVSRRQRADSR